MEYYVMNVHHGINESSGEPFTSHSFLNGTFLGMLSFGGVYKATKYPNKKSAKAVIKGRRGLQVISVADAMQLLLNKRHA